MQLQGLHHITMITGDAPRTVAFYADTLGLRLVKQTINFDQPDALHLYFGDEQGVPGSILTWFEFPGAVAGRAGDGMIRLIELGVGSEHALAFWEDRLRAHGCDSVREHAGLRFDDADGLALRLVVADDTDPGLRAEHPDVPPEHAIAGIVAARAYTPESQVPAPSPLLVETLGFADLGAGEYRLDGGLRQFRFGYDPAPAPPGVPGAGTVHHIARACGDGDQLQWQSRLRTQGRHVTEVLDRDYFTSIYFREPRHVLFEIATLSPGFAVDEDPEHLGEALQLPSRLERMRPELERALTPIENPRRRPR